MTWGEFAALGSGATRPSRVLALALTLVALCVGLLTLAGREAGPAPTGDIASVRVVSLSPAVTQWMSELGYADTLVGVGDGDALAPPGMPSVGTFVDVDLERLTGLAPTAVLAATAFEKLPPALRSAAERNGFALSAWAYPATIGDALAFGWRVGAALSEAERDAGRGGAAAASVHRRLEAVAGAVAGRPAVPALLLFSTQPLQACGVGTVHNELLSLAGGVNVLGPAAGSAPTLDRELLRGLAPEVVFVMRPGAAPQRGRDDPRFEGLNGLGLPAVEAGRVVLLNHPAVLLPGPTMDTTAALFATALHPEREAAVADAHAAAERP